MPDPPPYIARISLRDRFLGTGVLVTARLVLTCEHVIRNVGPRASLTLLIDGAHVSGKLKPNAKDAAKDLALIELSADAEAAPPAWSIDIAEGHQCNALGYHGGEYDAVPASVRSAQRQRVDLNQSLIEGCSGGALVPLIHDGGHCVGLLRRGGEGVISAAIGTAVVESFLGDHGIALPAVPPPRPARRAADIRPYLAWLRHETGEIDLDTLKVPREGNRRPEMDVLYIPLTTARSPEASIRATSRTKRATEAASVTLETALENRLLVVEGEAGSGKTTFLRRIAWALCREDRETKLKLPFKGFPIFIRIGKLDRHIHRTLQRPEPGDPTEPDDSRWFAHYLAAQGWGLDEAFFQEKLCGKARGDVRGRASNDNIVLLDGLDEASGSTRRAAISRLVKRCSVQGCRYVISTRPHSGEGSAALPGGEPGGRCDESAEMEHVQLCREQPGGARSRACTVHFV